MSHIVKVHRGATARNSLDVYGEEVPVKSDVLWKDTTVKERTAIARPWLIGAALLAGAIFKGSEVIGTIDGVVSEEVINQEIEQPYMERIDAQENDANRYRAQFLDPLSHQMKSSTDGTGILGFIDEDAEKWFERYGCLSGTVYDTRPDVTKVAGLFSSTYIESSSDNGVSLNPETEGIRVVPLNERMPVLDLVSDGTRMQPVTWESYAQMEVYGCDMGGLAVQDQLIVVDGHQ